MDTMLILNLLIALSIFKFVVTPIHTLISQAIYRRLIKRAAKQGERA